jgi:hypothetical protein
MERCASAHRASPRTSCADKLDIAFTASGRRAKSNIGER